MIEIATTQEESMNASDLYVDALQSIGPAWNTTANIEGADFYKDSLFRESRISVSSYQKEI